MRGNRRQFLQVRGRINDLDDRSILTELKIAGEAIEWRRDAIQTKEAVISLAEDAVATKKMHINVIESLMMLNCLAKPSHDDSGEEV